jgi:hypothetical protein
MLCRKEPMILFRSNRVNLEIKNREHQLIYLQNGDGRFLNQWCTKIINCYAKWNFTKDFKYDSQP